MARPRDDGPRLTTAELAKRWGMNEGTLRNWRSAKPPRGPKFITLGRKRKGKNPPVRYRLTDVIEYEFINGSGGRGNGQATR